MRCHLMSHGPFFVQFASLYPVVSFCHSFVPSHCSELHLFPPHKQLLVAVVLGAGVVAVSVIVMVLGQWHH